MLAIGRALLLEPQLLVMDEPTEGLAPVIVEQVAQALRDLAREGDIAVLLIEQNLGVAHRVADRIGVMVNGRMAMQMPAAELAADRELQERLLGVRCQRATTSPRRRRPPAWTSTQPAQVYTVRRAFADGAPTLDTPAPRSSVGFNRWNAGDAAADARCRLVRVAAAPSPAPASPAPSAQLFDFPVARRQRARRLRGRHLRHQVARTALPAPVPGTTRACAWSPSTWPPRARPRRPACTRARSRATTRDGEAAVFSGDRGSAVTAMAIAFERFVRTRRDLAGLISAGGSGGTSLATPAMRALPVGLPKVMVSTVASGDTRPYVGPSDICMMYSVTDVQGINRISEKVLGNAANALAGMMQHPIAQTPTLKPALGLTMFGVTTPCVQTVTQRLGDDYDCLVFHATGVGGPVDGKAGRFGLAGRRDRRVDDRGRRRDRRRRAVGRADAAWTSSRATRCPTWARAVRWTWSTSASGTACRNVIAAASCTATTRP